MRPLVVMIVYFGDLPPWLPITLHSMALNGNVSFVVINDMQPPTVLPPNVRFETISWAAMQRRLSLMLTPANASSVHYTEHYKANDIKPLAPSLYPELVAGYEWWAWADLDVVFGDLLKHMGRSFERPACCKVPLRANGQPRSTRAVNVYLHRGAYMRACACTTASFLWRSRTCSLVLALMPRRYALESRLRCSRLPLPRRRSRQRRLPALPQPMAEESVGTIHGIPHREAARHRGGGWRGRPRARGAAGPAVHGGHSRA